MRNHNMQQHTFHLVTPSPWPLMASISALMITFGGVMYMHLFRHGGFILSLGIILLGIILFVWWRDVIREATFEGMHTKVVQEGLKQGMVLFIASEVMFFFAFFWAFFHVSLTPSIQIGGDWPPIGIVPPFMFVGLFVSFLLVASAVAFQYAHLSLMEGHNRSAATGLFIAVIFGISFTAMQIYEYLEASFSISDSVYGSTFYMLTGFHGLHVIIGTSFMLVCLIRVLKGHFTKNHHVGLEAAGWYWSFVDWVWLGVFLSIYCWATSGIRDPITGEMIRTTPGWVPYPYRLYPILRMPPNSW